MKHQVKRLKTPHVVKCKLKKIRKGEYWEQTSLLIKAFKTEIHALGTKELMNPFKAK